MAPIHSSDEPNSRRRFLTLFGAAAAAATAGCAGSADEPDDGGGAADGSDEANLGGGDDGTDEPDGTAEPDGTGGGDGGQAVGSCEDLLGAATPLEPGDRQFPLLFEYPDTFEEYNVGILETDSIVGSQLGHIESAESASYPVNVAVYQHKGATTDEEAAENWATNFGTGERIDWQFSYDGEEVAVYDALPDDDEASKWQFMVSAHETEGLRGVSVQFIDDRSEFACLDALAEIARELIESMAPNPDWQ